MRSVLLKQVRPLVELFTAELVDLVTSRIEADLAHVGEILEYSLSAIASDLGAPPEDQAPTARREEGFDVGSMIRVDADSDQERRRGRGASKRRQAWGDAARGHAGLEWIDCADGTRRPVEPGIKPLAHGAPARVGLRGYGNGLVSEQAVAFIEAALEAGEAVIR